MHLTKAAGGAAGVPRATPQAGLASGQGNRAHTLVNAVPGCGGPAALAYRSTLCTAGMCELTTTAHTQQKGYSNKQEQWLPA